MQVAYQLGIAAIWHYPSGDRYLELPIADAIFVFNQIVLLEDKRLIPGLAECTRLGLLRMDIRGKIDNLMVTGLLNDIGKFDSQFLEAIVQMC